MLHPRTMLCALQPDIWATEALPVPASSSGHLQSLCSSDGLPLLPTHAMLQNVRFVVERVLCGNSWGHPCAATLFHCAATYQMNWNNFAVLRQGTSPHLVQQWPWCRVIHVQTFLAML